MKSCWNKPTSWLMCCALWFRKKYFCIFLYFFVSKFNAKRMLSAWSVFCSVRLFVIFDFHLSLIKRKIMHTFISFRFQSYTFQEDGKKIYICVYISLIYRLCLCLKTHLCGEWNFHKSLVIGAVVVVAVYCFFFQYSFLFNGSFFFIQSTHFSHILFSLCLFLALKSSWKFA